MWRDDGRVRGYGERISAVPGPDPGCVLLLEQMAGQHHAVELVGALVDLGDHGSGVTRTAKAAQAFRLAAAVSRAVAAATSAAKTTVVSTIPFAPPEEICN